MVNKKYTAGFCFELSVKGEAAAFLESTNRLNFNPKKEVILNL
ncbi:hypothetical protein [Pedobacter sp. GR22-10]|nr:hypothetical protein [Pedobacter sp. GR22-10]MCX2430877.1 hypothetical protein [Pedobacter sp. GR22-10]